MTIDPRPNGPLFVRGRVRIVEHDGESVREDTRVALCRCGSHRRIGFTTD